jgi:enamine deaminase RidA (YjgF/YER057c/UK114 family)
LDPRARAPDHTLWGGTEIRKQTEFIIQERLMPALEAAGSSLERSVKAQVYLRNIADFPDFVDVWSQYYQSIPCALTVVPTKGFAMVGGTLEINLMALTNGALRQNRRIPATVRADADRTGWPRGRRDDLARVPRAFARRIYAGGRRP